MKESKDNTTLVLKDFDEKGSLSEEKILMSDGTVSASMNVGAGKLKIKSNLKIGMSDIIDGFLFLKTKGDYFAIMAYIDGDLKNKRILDKIRELLRKNMKLAVTIGFGPRFLHSTGQYHKGWTRQRYVHSICMQR